MSNPTCIHLLDGAGERICGAEAAPAVPESALLGDTCTDGVIYCAVCTRGVLIPILTRAQSRSAADPLIHVILFLTTTPPEMDAVVVRILAPALVELDGFVAQVGGRHA